jgi:hypothetical protein
MEPLVHPAHVHLRESPRDRAHDEGRVGRYVVIALAILAIPPVVWAIGNPASRQPRAEQIISLVEDAGTIAAAVLAVALAWRRSAQSGTFPLAIFLALLASFFSHDALYRWAAQADLSQRTTEWIDLTAPAALIFMTASLVRFSAVFPQPLDATAVRSRGSLGALRRAALSPRPVWTTAAALMGVIVIASALGGDSAPRYVRPFTLPVIVAALLISVGNVRLGYRAADLAGRRRMFWVMEGFLLMGGVIALATVVRIARLLVGAPSPQSGLWFAAPALLAFFLLLVCLIIAMFFSGALDPTLALQRTAVYGVVGIALVFLFTAVESAVHEHVKAWLGLSDSNSGILVGGVVALSVEPLKHRISRLSDRILARFGVAPKQPKHPHAH